jgi:hypothetical protein
MSTAIVRRLLARKQEGEGWVKGLGLVPEPIAGGVRPCRGLVAGMPAELRRRVPEYSVGHKFSTQIAGRAAELRFWSTPTHPHPLAELGRHARRCFVWLRMLLPCQAHSTSAGSRGFVCDFILFPDQRRFPESPTERVGQIHCNGGLSYLGQTTAQFCVYREEELFKVFVHETFHAFGVHGRFPEGVLADRLAGLSPRHPLEYSEVYAETWARIMLVVFSAREVEGVMRGLEREAAHGWRGCRCVLGREAAAQGAGAGPQPTPAFEYYCLAGLAMVNHHDFLVWCSRHNVGCGDGVGFELRDPGLWLGWLGGVARSGLPKVAGTLGVRKADPHCAGESARMTWHDLPPRN